MNIYMIFSYLATLDVPRSQYRSKYLHSLSLTFSISRSNKARATRSPCSRSRAAPSNGSLLTCTCLGPPPFRRCFHCVHMSSFAHTQIGWSKKIDFSYPAVAYASNWMFSQRHFASQVANKRICELNY